MTDHIFTPETKVESLSSPKLVLSHGELHAYWKEFELGRGIDGWSRNDVAEKHDEVVAELEARNLPHQDLDGLDGEAEQSEVTQIPVELELKREEIARMSASPDSTVDLEDYR